VLRSAGWKSCRSAKSPPTPSSDIATVKKPDTAPPRSAACSAALRPVVAAAAVRMLERIETHIPT
jgi:hypothetical protein